MAYINNEIITVDAVLTRKGRELLAVQGGLNVNAYALSDDEIDYRLYQPNHPQGSAYYDLAIRNTPVFEAFTDETQVLKHKLVTLPSGQTSIPVISLGTPLIQVPSNYTGETFIVPSTNPVYNRTLGYTAILSNKNVGTIVSTEQAQGGSASTIPNYIGDISSTTAQTAVGLRFKFVPNSALTQTVTTTLTVVGNESGGSVSIPVTVTVYS
jgi:hypothetical protein